MFFRHHGGKGNEDLLKAKECLFIHLFSPFFVIFSMGEGVHK